MGYDFTAIENKWQKYWDEHKTFHAENDYSKPKFYALVEFPYPSGPNTVYVFPLPVTPYAITRQLFPRKKPSRRGFVVVSKTLSYHYSN